MQHGHSSRHDTGRCGIRILVRIVPKMSAATTHGKCEHVENGQGMPEDVCSEIDWAQEEREKDDHDVYMGTPHFSGCRDVLMGLMKLLPWRPQFLENVSVVDRDVARVFPLNRKTQAASKQKGLLPHRAVLIKPDLAAHDLRFAFQWFGDSRLSGFCLQFKEDGQVHKTLWEDSGDCRGSQGVKVTCLDDAGPLLEDGICRGAFTLRLSQVPSEVYCMLLVLVAEDLRNPRASAFSDVFYATLNLSLGPSEPDIWRYKQFAQHNSNVWVCAMFYRGEGASWQLEPMNVKLGMRAFVDLPMDDAVSSATVTLARHLRWLIKERRWTTICEERCMCENAH